MFVICGALLLIARSEESSSPSKTTTPATTAAVMAHAESPVSKKKDEKDPGEVPPEPDKPGAFAVAPPPFSPGIFPCMGCHDNEDLKPNPLQRKLTKKHREIVLQHDEKNRWCLDCHTDGDMNHLHLASGKLVEFTESYKLCGQCHGPTLRAWEAGEHGKRTGSWSGDKQYYLCANCHNPHSPHFKPLQPLPPPVRPENLRTAFTPHVTVPMNAPAGPVPSTTPGVTH
jgi:hypothetical protein